MFLQLSRFFQIRLRICISLVFICAPLLSPAVSQAADITVDCTGATPGTFKSLQSAIDSLDYVGPHTITMIAGPCNESVLILKRQRISIQPLTDGGGVTILSPDATQTAMRVLGSTGIILLQVGFANGSSGLAIDRNSEAQVLGCTISGNANAGVLVRGNSVVRIGNGLVQNNGGFGISINGGGSLTIDSGALIQNNGNGINVIDGSNVRIFAPTSIINNSGSGLTLGDAGSARIFGDPDTTPVVIEGNALAGINTFGGQAVLFGPVRICHNGSSGVQFHAGVRSDDNSSVIASGSGDVDISYNTGPGMEATNGGSLDLAGATISNNSEDGIRLLGNSQVAFFPPNTNVITGNGGRSILCDNSSFFFGDLTGLYGAQCRITELHDRLRRSWMENSPRDEKPAPYVFRARKH
jgi:hypothetical protein